MIALIAIDWTIKLSDVFLVGGGIVAFLKMFLSLRDALRDLTSAVGAKAPPSGLVGDVEHLKIESATHRDWLVEMRAKLGFRVI